VIEAAIQRRLVAKHSIFVPCVLKTAVKHHPVISMLLIVWVLVMSH
jgi:hypothetical protein